MIAVRWAILAATAGVMLAAFGAPALQPSALRVTVTATVGVLAPLFWPGIGATAARTALRVGGWSTAAAILAAIAIRLMGGQAQSLAQIVPACAVLMLLLIAAHAVAAALETPWRIRGADAERARELAGRTTATALAVLASVPLWLGPAAELLAPRQPWIVDAAVGASPLTHLAVASGNDLLRNGWFYQHANLAALRFSYPGLTGIMLSYGALALLLALVPLAARRRRPPLESDPPILPAMEPR
jgi:hypothetical protein